MQHGICRKPGKAATRARGSDPSAPEPYRAESGLTLMQHRSRGELGKVVVHAQRSNHPALPPVMGGELLFAEHCANV